MGPPPTIARVGAVAATVDAMSNRRSATFIRSALPTVEPSVPPNSEVPHVRSRYRSRVLIYYAATRESVVRNEKMFPSTTASITLLAVLSVVGPPSGDQAGGRGPDGRHSQAPFTRYAALRQRPSRGDTADRRTRALNGSRSRTMPHRATRSRNSRRTWASWGDMRRLMLHVYDSFSRWDVAPRPLQVR